MLSACTGRLIAAPTASSGSELAELADQPCQQRAEEGAAEVDPNVADIAAASGDEKLQGFISHGGEQAQTERLEQREILRVAEGSRPEHAEKGKRGKMRHFAHKVVGQPRENRPQDGQNAEAFAVADGGGHGRMPEDHRQPCARQQQPDTKSSFFHKTLHK